jgi:hypothetical protein
MDTDGNELPEDVTAFPAAGEITDSDIEGIERRLERERILCDRVDAGDFSAGSIRMEPDPHDAEARKYRIQINRNHAPAISFATLAHELGHLFLGHLGRDKALKIPGRSHVKHSQKELEAESVSYIICERNGVKSKSHTYLSNFVNENTTIDEIDVYQVMRATDQVEAALGQVARARLDANHAMSVQTQPAPEEGLSLHA